MAITDTAITATASQPRTFRRRLTTKAPIVAGFAASSIMTAMMGTEMTPFTIADQTSIFIESTPERSMPMPSTVGIRRDAARVVVGRAGDEAGAQLLDQRDVTALGLVFDFGIQACDFAPEGLANA